MTRSEQLKQDAKTYLAPTATRFDVCIERGSGAVCTDFEGKEYLDFGSGIGVNSLGWCDEQWAEAVARQAHALNHTSSLYYNQPMVTLAQKLVERSGLCCAFFANSGAEANEGAIKCARKYSYDHYGPGRYEIVTLQNSFHGRTITTLMATGQEAFHQYFDPFTEGFRYAVANDFASLEQQLGERTCAVFLELVQGEGGVIALDHDYVQKVAELCRERDILLMVDEVQTGIGRTGTLFCYEQYGILPDVVTIAKGIGGGLPLSGILFGEKTKNTLGPGTHATTYSGNPIACAGALAVMDRLDDAFLAQVAEKGRLIRERLAGMEHVKAVTGLGMMVGVAFDDGITGGAVVARCIERGVLFLTAKEKLRMLPPLTITTEQIEAGLGVLRDVLEHWED